VGRGIKWLNIFQSLLFSQMMRPRIYPFIVNPSSFLPTHLGFRDKAVLLESTFMRMGVLAALRSMARGGQVIGNA